MMCILQCLEQCKVNTWQLSLIYLLCHRSTQTCEVQASNFGQTRILTQMNDFTTLEKIIFPIHWQTDKSFWAFWLGVRWKYWGLQKDSVAKMPSGFRLTLWYPVLILLFDGWFALRGPTISWIKLYCKVCGYWQNAFLRSFVDFAYIVWLHCTMFTLFISSLRGDSSTSKCCKGGWVRLQFARWICIVLILSYGWLYDTVLVLSLAVFCFVAFSWLCATETFKQDHFFQTHVFHVLFSWMCARGCWVNAWRKWLSLQRKARVSFAIAVTCNILLHYVTNIFLLHTWTQWLSFRASSVAILFSALPHSSTPCYNRAFFYFKSVNVLLFAFNQVRGGGVGVPWMSKATRCKAICVVNLNGCAISIPNQHWICWP